MPRLSGTELFTFQDAVEGVLDYTGEASRDTRELRLAQRAVRNAYRKIQRIHRWAYYQRRDQVRTVASQTTGTVAYDHTGGSSERLVTLTGATFPTDAHLYKIVLNSQTYPIDEYLSSTTVSLTAAQNPGEDIAAGSDYTLYRSQYATPTDYRRGYPLVDLSQSRMLNEVSPDEALDLMSGNWQPQDPHSYTVRNTGEFYSGKCFEIIPPPSVERTYDYIYEAEGNPLTTFKYSTGTITGTAGSAAITGDSTVWTSAHVGAIMRFTASIANEPTGLDGYLDLNNAYVEQQAILSVDSNTSITLAANLANSFAATSKYTISDPIDIDSGPMWNVLQREADYQYALLTNQKDELNYKRQAAHDELILAMGAENPRLSFKRSSVREQYFYDLGDWAVNEPFGGSAV